MKLNLNFFGRVHEVECRTDWRERNLNLDINGVEVIRVPDYKYSKETYPKFAADYFSKRYPHLWSFPPVVPPVERPENGDPIRMIHSDFGRKDVSVHFRDKKGFLKQLGYEDDEWFMVNGMWKNRGPKHTNAPFVVADMMTLKRVDFTNVWTKFNFEYTEAKDHHVINPRYREGIDWYVFDDLEPDEHLVFRHFNRGMGVFSTLHGSCSEPLEGRPDRISVDTRVPTMEKL